MAEIKDYNFFKQTLIGSLPIGVGEFAQVSSIEGRPDLVIRKSETEIDGFRLLIYLTDEEREEFKLPKFHYHDEDGTFVIMERLYPMDSSILSEEFRCEPATFNRSRIIQDHEHPKVKQILQTALTLNEFLIEKGCAFELDVNARNIMLRKCGELVLSDPIGWLDI